jgi:hypothetical protein
MSVLSLLEFRRKGQASSPYSLSPTSGRNLSKSLGCPEQRNVVSRAVSEKYSRAAHVAGPSVDPGDHIGGER